MLLKVNQQINWKEKKKQLTKNIKYVLWFFFCFQIKNCYFLLLVSVNTCFEAICSRTLYLSSCYLWTIFPLKFCRKWWCWNTPELDWQRKKKKSNPNSIRDRFHLLLFGIFTLTLQSKWVNLLTCMPETALGQTLHNTSSQMDINKYS